MRITIDVSESDGRTATVHPGTTAAAAAGAGPAEAAAIDAGPAPAALLMALGASGTEGVAGSPDGLPADAMAMDGGGPPDWLVGVIEGGSRRRGE